jgi:hypothetical protein
MTAQLTDCAYLHSAFGPGCPYCWQPAAPASLDGRKRHGPRALAGAEPDRPAETAGAQLIPAGLA